MTMLKGKAEPETGHSSVGVVPPRSPQELEMCGHWGEMCRLMCGPRWCAGEQGGLCGWSRPEAGRSRPCVGYSGWHWPSWRAR